MVDGNDNEDIHYTSKKNIHIYTQENGNGNDNMNYTSKKYIQEEWKMTMKIKPIEVKYIYKRNK